MNINLKFNDNREIESAYIITLRDNKNSIDLSLRCAESCKKVNQKSKHWIAIDGTDGKTVKIPSEFNGCDYLKWIKYPNDKYSTSQIACFLSHYLLWAHCATIDQPIIILEHDAIMVQPLYHHKFYNCIQYLGSHEQYNGADILSIPPHGSIYNGQWRFICRAHAYAIDPPVARNLLSYVIKEGMTKTLDVIMRADIFPIVQDGLYAYDQPGISTIDEKEDYSVDY